MARARLRELGFGVGYLPCGANNAITDVAGVRVGHVTVLQDAPKILRTGVTAVCPLSEPYWETSVFAGFHCYNGFGELTGSHWLEEVGILTSPICLSSTFSIGMLRDSLLTHPQRHGLSERWHQPLAGETFDGFLSDGWDGPITREHVDAAIAAARPGPVVEGAVGGGMGMICHGFKGGIGTSSRRVETQFGDFLVAALVQSNYGERQDLTIDGVPVGRYIDSVPEDAPLRSEQGSIVIVVATDAPLVGTQCRRLARRAGIGLGRAGGFGSNRSGDFIVAFSTGNRLPFREIKIIEGLRMLPNEGMNGLFRGAAEAVEEAIVNSMTAAETTTGVGGRVVHAIPLDKLAMVMKRYGRGPAR